MTGAYSCVLSAESKGWWCAQCCRNTKKEGAWGHGVRLRGSQDQMRKAISVGMERRANDSVTTQLGVVSSRKTP